MKFSLLFFMFNFVHAFQIPINPQIKYKRNSKIICEDIWTYTNLLKELKHGTIIKGIIRPDSSVVTFTNDGLKHVTQLLPNQELEMANTFAVKGIDIVFTVNSLFQTFLMQVADLIPFVLISYLFISFMQKNSINQLREITKKPDIVTDLDTTFNDVAGLKVAKEELMEIVEFLNNPQIYANSGARIPKGALLEGPPGTGKTLLARAVAGEARVSFISVTASSFVEMYVGLGASRIRSLFTEARKNAPCIVWIDEIDAVAKKRVSVEKSANDERESTLNELLTAMDGFDKDIGIVVMAATNRADVLDDALLRPGRFDRRIPITLPNFDERMNILEVHSQNKVLSTDVDFSRISSQTSGFSGADLSFVMNEAAIRMVRRNGTSIQLEDIESAIERKMMGVVGKVSLNKKTRHHIAIHEAGHVIVAYYSDNYDKISKVSIVPRSNGAGGFTSFLGNEEQLIGGIYTKAYLKTRLAVLLGGRAAEEVILGREYISSGGSDDLYKVQELSRTMVSELGLGETIGAFGTDDEVGTKKLDEIDKEIEQTIDMAYGVALSVINAHKNELIFIAQKLVQLETISSNQLDSFLVGFKK